LAIYRDDDRAWLERLIKTVEAVIAERRQADEHGHRRLIHSLEQLRERLASKLGDMPPGRRKSPTVIRSYLMQLENGEPADPAV
jgi:hypothetical protein